MSGDAVSNGRSASGERKGVPSPDDLYTRVSLIGKAKNQNDNKAWSDFISYYREYIYRVVRRMGLSHHDADEVVQLTLLKIWNAIPSFEYVPAKGRFRCWICRIAGNTARNFIRGRGPVPVSLSSLDWEMEDLRDYSVQPEVEDLARKEWEEYLPKLALKRLSSVFDRKTLQVFRLCSEGLSAPEIARRLGLAESSVYVYKQRVREKLAQEIARLQREL